MTDVAGVMWSYRFVGGHQYNIIIEAEKTSTPTLLSGLSLQTSLAPAGDAVSPGQRLEVSPHLRTPSGLYLSDCQKIAKESFSPMACSADIRLNVLLGATVDRAASGFA
jgi:hypothetical protein